MGSTQKIGESQRLTISAILAARTSLGVVN